VSAQIITALRKRADALDAQSEQQDFKTVAGIQMALRCQWLANEFRLLADAAEAP
jgi:hypothetical protein